LSVNLETFAIDKPRQLELFMTIDWVIANSFSANKIP